MKIVKTEQIDISTLKDNPRQPRDGYHGVEALAESLRQDGQKSPIMVEMVAEIDKDGKETGKIVPMLIRGHLRTRAARIAGMPTLLAQVVIFKDELDRMSAIYDQDSKTLTSDLEIARVANGFLKAGVTLERLKTTLAYLLDYRFPVSDSKRAAMNALPPADRKKEESKMRNGAASWLHGISCPVGIAHLEAIHNRTLPEGVPVLQVSDYKALGGAYDKDAKIRKGGVAIFDGVTDVGPSVKAVFDKRTESEKAKAEKKAETIKSKTHAEIVEVADQLPPGDPIKAALLWAAGFPDCPSPLI